MVINRRKFFKVSASGAAMAAIGSVSSACAAKTGESNPVELKISFQEGTPPGENLNAKFDYMEQLGIVGFEPGGRGLARRVKEIQDALRGRNIKISAICAGFSGFILSSDEAVRLNFFDSMREIIAAAGELGSTGVIMVPAFNQQQPVMPHTQETRNFLCEQLAVLGNYATENGTTIILEPLNRSEAFYLRQVGDAASICRDTNNRGVMCMGDFWHMTREEVSDYGAFISAGKYLQHVHIASRRRRSMPGEDGTADNYIEGFRALKTMNYEHYVGFECGCQGDRNQVLPEAVKLMRNQWAMANI
jgi:sugar phosphate isomerase/epimerase